MTTNRIVNGIARMKGQIEARIAKGLTTAEKVEETRKALDMQWDEYTAFQNLKSIASVSGTLTLDEAMTIYNYLGEAGPDHFNAQPVEVKVILTQVLQELLRAKIKAA
jgi:hypothetical protein